MSFILVPSRGDELQVNAWNWRPTLELLLSEKLIDVERHTLLGAQGCGGMVDEELAHRIADGIDHWLRATNLAAGQRVLADLSVTSAEKKVVVFSSTETPDSVDVNDLYSTSHNWLVVFRDFCRQSGGFEVL